MVLTERTRRMALDAALLSALGLVMAVLGPFGTFAAPAPLRIVYWILACLVAGGAGIAADSWLDSRIRSFWPRVLAATAMMTIPVTVFIYFLNLLLLDLPPRWWLIHHLAWQVFVAGLLIVALRGLVWRRIVETRTVFAPPMPEAGRALRMRLSPIRRRARLIALEAEDHYVRVHTDAGTELVGMRFAEALDELAGAYGFRLHRSWWAAGDAIETVRWTRGRGEARLAGGLVAPVSRSQAALLREAGWR